MQGFLLIAQFVVLIIGPVVRQILAAIGVGFITYVGFSALSDYAFDYATNSMGQAGAAVQAILGLAKIDVAMNIYLAAVVTRVTLAGINKASNHRRRQQVWTKPGDSLGSIDA